MLGEHCIKTWCASQGAFAPSGAEPEFYAMVEAVARSKGLLTLAREMGSEELSLVAHLGTDSNATKSFVNQRRLGKMRHLDIRDLWLQTEIREGRVEVHKVFGTESPVDLMTEISTVREVEDRSRGVSVRMELTSGAQQMPLAENDSRWIQ